MIKQLKIENLQSHVNSDLEFHPGVNVIVGPSDVGKSAIIRALKWVALNRPSGDAIRRHQTKRTTVSLDGVVKSRTASEHTYAVDGVTYKALRSDVPSDVSDSLRLTAENFQEQHDAYFLISDPPGQVAKTLNQVADLEVIDLSIQAVKQRVKAAKASKVFQMEELEKQKAKISSLDWVAHADQDLTLIEAVEAKGAEIHTSKLEADIQTVDEINSILEGFPDTRVAIKTLGACRTELISIDLGLGSLIAAVENNQQVIPDTKKDLAEAKKCIELFEKVEDQTLQKLVTKVLIEMTNFNEFPLEIAKPSGLVESIQKAEKEIQELNERILEAYIAEDCSDTASSSYTVVKLEYEKFKQAIKICPMCKSQLKG